MDPLLEYLQLAENFRHRFWFLSILPYAYHRDIEKLYLQLGKRKTMMKSFYWHDTNPSHIFIIHHDAPCMHKWKDGEGGKESNILEIITIHWKTIKYQNFQEKSIDWIEEFFCYCLPFFFFYFQFSLPSWLFQILSHLTTNLQLIMLAF